MRWEQAPARRLGRLLLLLALLLASSSAAAFSTMHALLEEGRYDLAVQVEGPRLVSAFPEDAEAYYLYSRALYLVGNYAEAREQLGRALALADEAHYRWLEALLEAEAGRPQVAQEKLARLFGEAPSYALAMDWARVAWQAGDYAGAIDAFRAAQATEEGQAQPWPYLNQARLLGYEGRFEEAISVLQTTIDLVIAAEEGSQSDEASVPHPAYTEAFYLLGEAYEALGERENAWTSYYTALTADPLHQPSRIALNRLEDEEP